MYGTRPYRSPLIPEYARCTIRNCRGGVHAFSAKFVGVFQGLFGDFRFGDFEACGSGVFDDQTGIKWNAPRRVK